MSLWVRLSSRSMGPESTMELRVHLHPTFFSTALRNLASAERSTRGIVGRDVMSTAHMQSGAPEGKRCQSAARGSEEMRSTQSPPAFTRLLVHEGAPPQWYMCEGQPGYTLVRDGTEGPRVSPPPLYIQCVAVGCGCGHVLRPGAAS